MLACRGIVVTYETIRQWCLKLLNRELIQPKQVKLTVPFKDLIPLLSYTEDSINVI